MIQKLRGFFFGEAQIVGADLGQLSAHAPASQRERRVGTADENEMDMRCARRRSSAPDQAGDPGRRFGFRVVMRLAQKEAD